MTGAFTPQELETIDREDEVVLRSRRPDGSLGSQTTIWIVRDGDHAYVRSAFGPGNRWYHRARGAGEGHVAIGDLERDVRFEHLDAADPVGDAVDAAYHAKYDDTYPKKHVDPCVDDVARGCTLRLLSA